MTSPTSLSRRLLQLHEEKVERLKGLICAAYGLSETILSDAEDRGIIEPAVLGLKQVVADAEVLVCEVENELKEAQELAGVRAS